MKKSILFISFSVCLLIGVTIKSLFSQGWEIQAEGLARRWQAIDAVDSNIAVAIAWIKEPNGGEGIFRTLNGGKTWHEISWTEGHSVLIDISMTDSLNIWVASNHSICHTSDGGKNWEVQYSPDTTLVYISYIEMFDSLNGIAEADAFLEELPVQILKTIDGGKNWISQNQSYFINGFLADYWRSIDFVSPDIGYGGFLYFNVPLDTVFLEKTTDGGVSWNKTGLCASEFYTIKFFNKNLGIAASLANKPVYRTLDGGGTWTSYTLNFDDGWSNDIEFIPNDPAKIFAIFDFSLYFSNDTGKTWAEISVPSIYSLRDIEMIDDKHGWIVGENGIIHTSNGGVTSIFRDEKVVIKELELHQNYPNPFNSKTVINFHLFHAERVTISVFNLMGEELAILINDQYLSAGQYYIEFNTIDLSSGIYFYRIKTDKNQHVSKKMILLK